jgi:hypothetical protein
VDFTNALTAQQLWGWPLDVLDHLLELRQLAYREVITLEEWRAQDAAARAKLPTVDTAEVLNFQHELIVNGPRDIPQDVRGQLTGRLTALGSPAPTDEELWKDLKTVDEALANRHGDPGLKELYRKERERIAAWLTRPGGGIDAITGIPWSLIASYRVIDDPDLGQVPQYLDTARKLATKHASPEELQQARMVRDTSDRRAVTASFTQLFQERLTWLPRLLLEASKDEDEVKPLLIEMERIWSHPHVQQLLIEETASGWPPHLTTGHPRPHDGE